MGNYVFSPALSPPGSPEFSQNVLEMLKRIMDRLDDLQGYTATPQFFSHMDMKNYRITNVKDPLLPQDVLTLAAADRRYGYNVATQQIEATSVSAPTSSVTITPYQETPTGTVDGANKVFTLKYAPKLNSLAYYLNGQLLIPGTDYTLSGQTVTMTNAPQSAVTPADSVYAVYFY